MKEFLQAWKDYQAECLEEYKKEQERARKINDEKLKNGKPGFEFPKKTPDNTPSFEGFMLWIENHI